MNGVKRRIDAAVETGDRADYALVRKHPRCEVRPAKRMLPAVLVLWTDSLAAEGLTRAIADRDSQRSPEDQQSVGDGTFMAV